MRKLWAAGAATVVCLTLGAPVMAQEESPEGEASVPVTATQACTWTMDGAVLTGTCTYTANDPRVTGEVSLTLAGAVGIPGGDAPLQTFDAVLKGPEGTWTGRYWVILDQGTKTAWATSVLSGDGVYAGWTYIAASKDESMSGSGDFVGVLYQGPPPPGISVGSLPPAASEPTASPPPAASLATIGEPADDGARIIEIETLDERMVDLTIDSPAVGTAKVRLLLPAGFDPEAEADWPVLYLLHGAVNDHTSWTRETDVEELTADLPLLVVMPEAGQDGWYADWWNEGEGGSPMWETFHTRELLELLERNWQAGDERAVAGLSMGGLGAMNYAARHPGLFGAAASFSGMLQPVSLDPGRVGFDVPPDLWGDRTAQADIWAAHDPVALAAALKGTALYVSYGTGEPGPLDADGAGFDELEASFAAMNEAFVARLSELDIPVTVETGPGTHTMPYIERGLHQALPMLLEALGM